MIGLLEYCFEGKSDKEVSLDISQSYQMALINGDKASPSRKILSLGVLLDLPKNNCYPQ